MDTGEWILECMREKKKVKVNLWWMALLIALWIAAMLAMASAFHAQEYTNDQIADAIYKAEGGMKTSHPYGILAHYKTTTPRQACINTINSARKRFDNQTKETDFIHFLSLTYCPIGASNDPLGLNVNWEKNVRYFLNANKV